MIFNALHTKYTKTFIRICLVGVVLILVSCGAQNNSQNPEDLENLRKIVNKKNFEIVNDWANPIGWKNVNLMGNLNYIRFQKDSVKVSLPYYGVRHSGGGSYGSNFEGGIRFEGLAENCVIIERTDKNNIVINFEGQMGNENLDFSILLYPNGNTRTSVTSSQRNSISYNGEIKDLRD